MIDREVVPCLLAPTNLRVYRKKKKDLFYFKQSTFKIPHWMIDRSQVINERWGAGEVSGEEVTN